MSKVITIAITLFFISNIKVYSQTELELKIRALENQEKDAVIKGDTIVLFKLWSPNYVINGATNSIVSYSDLKRYYQKGIIDHSYFDRIIEKITITDSIAIVMGKEIKQDIKDGNTSNSSNTRRFTNIWININGEWFLTARQVTNIN
jgi:hypothetical protein